MIRWEFFLLTSIFIKMFDKNNYEEIMSIEFAGTIYQDGNLNNGIVI